MTQGEFRAGFNVWTRQCGWYLLVLVGFGAYFPEQWRLGAVYLGMLVFMWLGGLHCVRRERRPSSRSHSGVTAIGFEMSDKLWGPKRLTDLPTYRLTDSRLT